MRTCPLLRVFPRKRESRRENWVPAFAGTGAMGLLALAPQGGRNERPPTSRQAAAKAGVQRWRVYTAICVMVAYLVEGSKVVSTRPSIV
jgi:hypothetical protein